MALELGISTYTFPWAIGVGGLQPQSPLHAFDLLALAKHYQVNRLQFGDNLPLHFLPEEMRKEIRQKSLSSKIHLEVGTKRLTVENISQYLAIASDFHSPFLRVIIDDHEYHPDVEEITAIIKEVLPQLREKKIVLAIENHDRFAAKTLAEIIENTDPEWVGICLDTANSLGAGEGIKEILEVLGKYTVNLHIKDFKISRVWHKMGFAVEGCQAGKGMLNIPFLLDYFSDSTQLISVTLELWSNPLQSLDETINREKEWAEGSLQYLKQFLTKK